METENRSSATSPAPVRVELPAYDGFPNLEPLNVDERIREFSGWLESCGVSPENLITEYLNELVRIAVESHGLVWSSVLMGQLQEQASEIFQRLHEASLAAASIPNIPAKLRSNHQEGT